MIDVSVGFQQRVAAQVVADAVAVNSRCLLLITVSIFTDFIGFIEGDPRLNPISELSEAQISVVMEVMCDFRIGPST